MKKTAHFKVDTKLAELLGENYRSIEAALKELVDNSYDADSEKVVIELPEQFSPGPSIVIKDNGSGMTEKEIRTGYLNIASSRISRKGDKSIRKNRKVKGRKGIGKFAGLMIAQEMEMDSYANGKHTKLIINKNELALADYDLEGVPLTLISESCALDRHGTTIKLHGINQNFHYPNPDRLKQLLIWDYGRERDFEIYINGEPIGVLDLPGKSYTKIFNFDGKTARLEYTITEKPIKQPGIILRVQNKIVGRPVDYLASDELIPKKLRDRVYGELICDDLAEQVTADHGAVIEGSKLMEELKYSTESEIRGSVDEVFKIDMKMARARYQRKINKELARLPEYKQPYAKKALHKTLEKFYGETEDRINTVISVMISAMEKDHYWDIISNIKETDHSDIERFADSLNYFGLLEMSIISSQAINRLKFLDEFELLISNPKTLESTVHRAFEKNTWILGDDYSVIMSDTSLKTALKNVLDKLYKGNKAKDRPDLLLGRKIDRSLILIEFKRPSFTLNRDTERQALEYRDELNTYFHSQKIPIILIGGKVKQNISSHNERDDVEYRSYIDIIGRSRAQIQWLLEELKKD